MAAEKETEVGVLTIYFDSHEKVPGGGRRLLKEPLYRLLVRSAKSSGLMAATATRSRFGYSNGNLPSVAWFTAPHFSRLVVVELVGQRRQLRSFFTTHQQLLKGRTAVFGTVEHWSSFIDNPSVATAISGRF